jgi:hypothetical protein
LKIEKSINLEETNNKGFTALIIAANAGHLEIVQWLVSVNANLNHTDKEGRTALDVARVSCHNAIVNYLSEQLEAQKQKEQKKNVTFQKEIKELSTLSKLGRLHLSESQQLFNQLELKAKELAIDPYTAEFYQTRGDFYDWLASQENNNSLKNEHYNNAIKDYKKAQSINSSLTFLNARIQEILTIQNNTTPPLPPSLQLFKAAAVPKTQPSRPQFFKPTAAAPKTPPTATPKTPPLNALPARPKLSAKESRLGIRRRNLGL